MKDEEVADSTDSEAKVLKTEASDVDATASEDKDKAAG